MQTPAMQTVILAAGRGTRLGSHTTELPKSLLSLSGKPIIDYTLTHLQSFPDNQIVVVGGFEFDQLADHLKNWEGEILLVQNHDYEKGNLLTLLAAKDHLHQDFCITNADHIFSHQILKKVYQTHQNITVVCDFDRNLTDDDMKIKKNEEGTFKQMSKNLTDFDGGYIGMTLVPHQKAPLYWKAAETLLKREGDLVNVEEVVNELSSVGEKIVILDASGSRWFEVDTAEDLARAEEIIQKMDL